MENNCVILLLFWFLVSITILIFWIKSYLHTESESKSGATFVRRLDRFIISNEEKYAIMLNHVPNLKLYLEGRVIDQIDWYESGSQKNKKKYTFIRISTLIVSSLIPLLVILNNVFGVQDKIITSASAVLAAFIAIANGWNEICLYQSKYIEFRLVTERLKNELALYLSSAGHYDLIVKGQEETIFKEIILSFPKSENFEYYSESEKVIKATHMIQFKEFVSRVEAIINSDCYKWSESITNKK